MQNYSTIFLTLHCCCSKLKSKILHKTGKRAFVSSYITCLTPCHCRSLLLICSSYSIGLPQCTDTAVQYTVTEVNICCSAQNCSMHCRAQSPLCTITAVYSHSSVYVTAVYSHSRVLSPQGTVTAIYSHRSVVTAV